MNDEILTIDEAAALLKVAPAIVADLLVSSELAGRHIGGEWRTTKRALISYVDGVPLQMECCPPGMCCLPSSEMAELSSPAAGGRCCS